jgi:hypothetical protein
MLLLEKLISLFKMVFVVSILSFIICAKSLNVLICTSSETPYLAELTTLLPTTTLSTPNISYTYVEITTLSHIPTFVEPDSSPVILDLTGVVVFQTELAKLSREKSRVHLLAFANEAVGISSQNTWTYHAELTAL